MASRLTPSFEVRISYFLCHSCTPLDQLSMISLLTSSPGSHLGQHELVRSLQQSFLRIHSETRWANAQANRIKGDLPQKTVGNSKPATGRTDRSESETTACRSDTTAGSDSTTTRGYVSATPPPPPKKQQGNTPQTRPTRTSRPPHSS